MTSLIDVIFLLLLFFMLSSTFSKFGEIDLTSSTRGQGSFSNQNPPVFVRRSLENLTINGTEMTLEEAEKHLASLHKKGTKALILSIDDNLSSQLLLETMVRFKKAAPLQVTLVN